LRKERERPVDRHQSWRHQRSNWVKDSNKSDSNNSYHWEQGNKIGFRSKNVNSTTIVEQKNGIKANIGTRSSLCLQFDRSLFI